jgi:putative transposase
LAADAARDVESQGAAGGDSYARAAGQILWIGAVNYHTGETVVQFQLRKRRKEIAQLLEALLEKHPTGTVYVAWDNATTHEDEEVEDVLRAAAGRLVLLYLPTYSPWLNPIEMLWRHFRREVTHCELFEKKQALLTAARDLFARYNRCPEKVLSIIGSPAAELLHPACIS